METLSKEEFDDLYKRTFEFYEKYVKIDNDKWK